DVQIRLNDLCGELGQQMQTISNKKKPLKKNDSDPSRSSHRITKSPDSFPIVAIGASAGGLEAVTELLKHLPANTGMAFIYVQHLSPQHESILASLLAKNTKMKVQQAENKEKMEPNN